MTACLPDRVLWSLSEGDGPDDDHEHLAACRLCQWRARRLAHDVKVIRDVLRGVPPSLPVRVRVASPRPRWAIAATLAAVAVALTWGVRTPASAPVAGTDMPVLEALSRAVFLDAGPESALGSPSELELMATAVDEVVPCEWQPGGCEEGALTWRTY